MRKVTQEVCKAFTNGFAHSVGNSFTDGERLFLHGNKIAEKRSDGIYISNAGWPTVTTRERLNGLPGVRLCQKKGEQYLNGEVWGGDWTKVTTV